MRAFEKIPAFQQWQKVEAIHRGWSTDLKFKVTKNQETFLLRIFQQEELLAKQQEYQFIKKVAALGFPVLNLFYVHLFLKVNKDTCY